MKNLYCLGYYCYVCFLGADFDPAFNIIQLSERGRNFNGKQMENWMWILLDQKRGQKVLVVDGAAFIYFIFH